MSDTLQLTQSRVESVPSTSTSTISNTPSLNPSFKLKVANENKISAPAGREIINLSRRRLYIGRAGAGNAMSSESNPERQRRIRELIAREQEVLESRRAQAPKSYHTGRGGAGSKGHVKVKGKVPNRERALAKEREIQAKWKEARENAGRLKTGRGGRGNIVQAVSSDENSFMTPSRTESRDDTLHLEGPSSAFGVTSSEKRRRRHFSVLHKPLSSRSGSSQSFYAVQDSSRAPSAAANHWDSISDTDSYYGLVDAGIVTTKVDPLTIAGSLDLGKSTTSSALAETPNQVFLFDEQRPRKRKLSLKIGHKASADSGLSTPPSTSPNPSSLIQPFKKLHLANAHDFMAIPTNVVIDIRATYSKPSESNSEVGITPYPYRTDWTTSSESVSTIDPPYQSFIPPTRILSPPPPAAPPTTPAQRPISDELESIGETGYDSSPTSDTFGSITTHANMSIASMSPSTPRRSGPPKLPAFYFHEPVPPRRTDIRWSKRPLPIPPVPMLRISTPPSPKNGPPSTSDAPVDNEIINEGKTPTASPSSYYTALPSLD